MSEAEDEGRGRGEGIARRSMSWTAKSRRAVADAAGEELGGCEMPGWRLCNE